MTKLKFETIEEVVKLTGLEVWGAAARPYSFIISKNYTGTYRCSWKNYRLKTGIIHHFKEDASTLLMAVAACEVQLGKLRGQL